MHIQTATEWATCTTPETVEKQYLESSSKLKTHLKVYIYTRWCIVSLQQSMIQFQGMRRYLLLQTPYSKGNSSGLAQLRKPLGHCFDLDQLTSCNLINKIVYKILWPCFDHNNHPFKSCSVRSFTFLIFLWVFITFS